MGRRRKRRDDPFVPIDPGTLRRALASKTDKAGKPWSVYKLAQEVRRAEKSGDQESTASRQALNHLLRALTVMKCRLSRRTALEKALGLSKARLGKSDTVHRVFEIRPLSEYDYSEKTRAAAAAFQESCQDAIARDMPDASADEHVEVLQRLMSLLEIRTWRAALLNRDGKKPRERDPEPPIDLRWEPVDRRKWDHDHEDASLALTRLLSHTLRPWFLGRERLDVGALRKRTQAPSVAHYPAASQPSATVLKLNQLSAQLGSPRLVPASPPRTPAEVRAAFEGADVERPPDVSSDAAEWMRENTPTE